MEISGKIIAVLPLQSGQGKNGLWRSLDFVVETGDQYPKRACINLFNDRIDKFPVAVGDSVTVSFDIEAREYNGRWYNTVRAWNVKKQDATAPEAQADAPVPPPAFDEAPADSSGSDLPF